MLLGTVYTARKDHTQQTQAHSDHCTALSKGKVSTFVEASQSIEKENHAKLLISLLEANESILENKNLKLKRKAPVVEINPLDACALLSVAIKPKIQIFKNDPIFFTSVFKKQLYDLTTKL